MKAILLSICSIALTATAARAQTQEPFQADYYSIGNWMYDLAVADLNHDGIVDFIAPDYFGKNAVVGKGTGGGVFGALVTYPIGGSSESIEAGDLNNDGNADAAIAFIAGQTGVVSFFGDGAGNLVNLHISNVPSSLRRIRLGDLNNDGRLDFVACGAGTQALYSSLNNGSGFFPNIIVTSAATNDLDLADFNNDGKLDVTYLTTSLIVRPGNGAGGFGQPRSYSCGAMSPNALAAVDLNHSGLMDVAVGGFNYNITKTEFASLLATATGFSVFSPLNTQAGTPRRIYPVDVNNDGNADIVSTGQQTFLALPVITNDGTGLLTLHHVDESGFTPYSARFTDITNDGNVDLIFSNFFGVAVRKGNGAADFALGLPFINIPTGVEQLFVKDLDRDGAADLLTFTPGVSGAASVLLGSGGGNFTPYFNTSGASRADVGDFNSDGFADSVRGDATNFTILKIAVNNGGGIFSDAGTITTPGHKAFAVCDADQNGTLDVIVGIPPTAFPSNAYFLTFLGDGAGGFTTGPTSMSSFAANNFSFGDWNGDGASDIAANSGSELGRLLSNHAGGFVNSGSALNFSMSSTIPAVWGDITNDGNQDVIIYNDFSTTQYGFTIFAGDGLGGVLQSKFKGSNVGNVLSLVITDFDADGILDAAANYSGLDIIYIGDGTINLNGPTIRKYSPGAFSSAAADFDTNGCIDLACAGADFGELAIISNNTNAPIATQLYGTGTSACAGRISIAAKGIPQIGNANFRIRASQAPPSSLGLLIFSDLQDFAGSDPFSLGILMHIDILGASQLYYFDIYSDPSGGASLNVAIPNNPLLIQQNAFAQTFWTDPLCTNTNHLYSSSGLKLTIQ